MKVFYRSALKYEELTAGSIYRTVPCEAYLELHKEKGDEALELLYNGTLIGLDNDEIQCNEEAELIIRQGGNRMVYAIKPSLRPLSHKFASAYEQFSYEYRDRDPDFNEIESIQVGALKLYAVDQSTEVYDWTDTFEQIQSAYSAFKAICEKPKSHLRAVNEVRPIETVKRIGYESIPYLAAHSEDWLARTASGLKPARLFSRVEDDEYQIYENRVVKTLIDLIISFLRKKEKELRDQRDQLRGIMNSSVQTGSFGFDVSFQKAVSELITMDETADAHRSKMLDLVETLQKTAYLLLKKYRTLRQTKLYRYLKKSRVATNPLNETNILTMDKHYSVVYRLWRTIHHVIAPRSVEDEGQLCFDDLCEDYRLFCKTLCGYSAHVLGFEIQEDGLYYRSNDNIELLISEEQNGLIRVILSDKEKRSMIVPAGVILPMEAQTEAHGFYYDGYSLFWPNDITDGQIEALCRRFKTKESRGKEQAEENHKYTVLKQAIGDAQRQYDKPSKTEFVICPVPVEIDADSRGSFTGQMLEHTNKLLELEENRHVVIAVPVCGEFEQKLVDYAKGIDDRLLIIPLTMFDINSFRRIQNLLYRHIMLLGKDSCPNCGGKLRKNDNQRICDSCNQMMLTDTICPNESCRHKYTYISYKLSEDTIQKMAEVDQESFYQWDSLFQYKDIVPMSVEASRIRTICPCCKQ